MQLPRRIADPVTWRYLKTPIPVGNGTSSVRENTGLRRRRITEGGHCPRPALDPERPPAR